MPPYGLNDWMSGAGQSQNQWNRQMSGIGAYTGQDWQQNQRRNPWTGGGGGFGGGGGGYGGGGQAYSSPSGGTYGQPFLSYGSGQYGSPPRMDGGFGGGFGGGGGGSQRQNPWTQGMGGGGFGGMTGWSGAQSRNAGTSALPANRGMAYEEQGGFGGMMNRIGQMPAIESIMRQYNATPEMRANIIRDFLYGRGQNMAGFINQMMGGGGWG